MLLSADCLSSKCWPAVVEADALAVYADSGVRLGSKKSMSLLKYWGEGKSISHHDHPRLIHDSLLYVLFAITGTDAHFFAYVADRKLHAIAAPARAGADRIPRETAGFDDERLPAGVTRKQLILVWRAWALELHFAGVLRALAEHMGTATELPDGRLEWRDVDPTLRKSARATISGLKTPKPLGVGPWYFRGH